MDIRLIQFTDPKLIECQAAWETLAPEVRLIMSQYDLAEETEVTDITAWMMFLSDTRVKEQLDLEMRLYTEAQQRKLIAKAALDSKSTGTAQMIGALGKTQQEQGSSGGDMFVYTYVPANIKEQESPVFQMAAEDIFATEKLDIATNSEEAIARKEEDIWAR